MSGAAQLDPARIDGRKVALIKIAQKQTGLEDDDYRALLQAEAGVSSARDLTQAGFARVMARFERLGFVSTSAARKPSGRRGRRDERKPNEIVTAEQLATIEATARRLNLSRAYVIGISKRACRVSWPQTRSQAIRVIEALKKIETRKAAAGVAS